MAERVPSGVMQSWNVADSAAVLARLSVMFVCLLRHTGMPPIFLKKHPKGQKNHSFFIRKLLFRPSAREYSKPIIKSQLLVCGAKHIINLSGCASVTLVVHPMRLNNIQRQSDFSISMALLFRDFYLVDDFRDLLVELVDQVVEVCFGGQTGFRMGNTAYEIALCLYQGVHQRLCTFFLFWGSVQRYCNAFCEDVQAGLLDFSFQCSFVWHDCVSSLLN